MDFVKETLLVTKTRTGQAYICSFIHSFKKKEILTFATAWMDLQRIKLSEISQSERDKYHMISLTCGI